MPEDMWTAGVGGDGDLRQDAVVSLSNTEGTLELKGQVTAERQCSEEIKKCGSFRL